MIDKDHYGSRAEIRWRKENVQSGRPVADNCGNPEDLVIMMKT